VDAIVCTLGARLAASEFCEVRLFSLALNMTHSRIRRVLLTAAIAAAVGGHSVGQVEPPRRMTAFGSLPLTDFYTTKAPLTGKPGSLIRSESFDGYDLPAGASAIRILYESASAAGDEVASSGVVLLPDGTPPSQGWPVVAWAHPFIGTARTCAPSLMTGLHSAPLLNMYLNLGYAVVATDYAGLGTDFRNAFIDMKSNATDVIYAMQAAHQLKAPLGQRWVTVGEDDGGAAALAVAELEDSLHDTGFLGSVAISGAFDLKTALDRMAQGPWQDSLAFLAYGIQTVYPKFRPADWMTSKGLERYRVANQSCSTTAAESRSPLKDMLKPSWQSDPLVRDFVQRNTLGLKPARAPLLIISTESANPGDSMTARVVGRMCGQGDRIDVKSYSAADSSEVMGASMSGQVSWIKARFAGQASENDCR